MKEVTPEDIKKIFMEKDIPLIDGLMSPCIETINQMLITGYKGVISSGHMHIPRNSLDLPDGFRVTETSWNLLRDGLSKFFKSWDITTDQTHGKRYFKFTPKKPIVIEMAPSVGKKKDIPLVTSDPVENRSDILDLG